LWEMFPDHPNLLPAYFDDDPRAAELGTSFVRKPIYSREGANIVLVRNGIAAITEEEPYGAEGFIRQARATLHDFAGRIPVIGSWMVGGSPCGISIREGVGPITRNASRFIPHAIL